MLEIDDYFENILPKYQRHLESARVSVIDARVLDHQIPGGMMSNLASQLREADSIDRLSEVLEEIPRTRKDLGYPPLVTPLSQMTGAQAVNNVLFGRYKMITGAVKDYVEGKFGTPPGEIASELREQVPTGQPSEATSTPLPPEMDAAREAVKHITTDIDDVLTYALYPSTGMRFLRIKHGLDPMPSEMMDEPAPVKDGGAEPTQKQQPTSERARSRHARSFSVYVDGEHFEVEVDPQSPEPAMRITPAGAPPAAPRVAKPTDPKEERENQEEPRSAPTAAANEVPVTAPIPGVVLRYAVQVGDSVSEGDSIVVLEAMKMENTLPAPADGKVKALVADIGATVAKDAILAVIST